MKHYRSIETPLGSLFLAADGRAITDLVFSWESPKEHNRDWKVGETPLLREAERQLGEYFSGHRTEFDLPLNPKGTPFQRTVWEALLAIPYGETRSYREIAKAIGNPNACRAVGMANNRNPISILIPCHRVIGANGSLVGYGGGLPIKEYLLDLERQNKG